ncbi:MAG TPA: M15 family metallopeptidase [Nitrospirota bacterium]|jgi:peptidoglycan L-alanyl-D-glutamate endopeptidase CwlK
MANPKTGSRNGDVLAGLLPEVAVIAEKHLALCLKVGIELVVVQSFRSIEEQARLYAIGRTVPGRKVTNARPGSSWHNFRRAYDVAVMEDGEITWASSKYSEAGEIGKSIGLVWGGDFKSVRGDLGHFEYHPGLTIAQAKNEERRR